MRTSGCEDALYVADFGGWRLVEVQNDAAWKCQDPCVVGVSKEEREVGGGDLCSTYPTVSLVCAAQSKSWKAPLWTRTRGQRTRCSRERSHRTAQWTLRGGSRRGSLHRERRRVSNAHCEEGGRERGETGSSGDSALRTIEDHEDALDDVADRASALREERLRGQVVAMEERGHSAVVARERGWRHVGVHVAELGGCE